MPPPPPPPSLGGPAQPEFFPFSGCLFCSWREGGRKEKRIYERTKKEEEEEEEEEEGGGGGGRRRSYMSILCVCSRRFFLQLNVSRSFSLSLSQVKS